MSPNCIDHVDIHESRMILSEHAQFSSPGMGCLTGMIVLQRKLQRQGVSAKSHFNPRPPSQTGRFACIHWISDRASAQLVIC